MKKKTGLLCILMAASSLSHAETIGYTNSVTMNHNQIATVNLPQFNSSLGTLTGVYLTFITQLAGANVQLDNDSAAAQNGTAAVLNTVASFSTSTRIDGSGINRFALYIDASQVFSLGATSGDNLGEFNVTASSDYASWSPGTLSATSAGTVNSSVFADYIGTGTFNGTVLSTFYTSASFDGSDGYFQGNTPNGMFTGEVLYTYSIPEPATASMMALAGLIALLVRRHFLD